MAKKEFKESKQIAFNHQRLEASNVIAKPTEFELFKKSFLFWKEKLGLKNWEILYFVEKDSKEKDTPYATVNYILDQRQAWVYFYGSNNNPDIDYHSQALHEALHLLLADCETDVIIEHGIINTFINFLKDEKLWNLSK